MPPRQWRRSGVQQNGSPRRCATASPGSPVEQRAGPVRITRAAPALRQRSGRAQVGHAAVRPSAKAGSPGGTSREASRPCGASRACHGEQGGRARGSFQAARRVVAAQRPACGTGCTRNAHADGCVCTLATGSSWATCETNGRGRGALAQATLVASVAARVAWGCVRARMNEAVHATLAHQEEKLVLGDGRGGRVG